MLNFILTGIAVTGVLLMIAALEQREIINKAMKRWNEPGCCDKCDCNNKCNRVNEDE